MYKKVVLLASVALLSQTANAVSVVGVVEGIGCHNIDNSCWVQVQGATASPYCNNSTQLRWDAGTTYGARWYATFLAAQLAGKRVFLEVSSTACGPQGYPTFVYGSVSD